MVKWLNFTKNISDSGNSMIFFGKVLLNFITIISVIFFWFFVFVYYQNYREIAFFMINFIKLGLEIFIIGFLIHYLFYFINEIIHKRQMENVKIKVKGKKK